MSKVTWYELEPAPCRPFEVSFVWFGLHVIQLGFHVDLKMKNIELHLPFCFIRVGLRSQFIFVKNGETNAK